MNGRESLRESAAPGCGRAVHRCEGETDCIKTQQPAKWADIVTLFDFPSPIRKGDLHDQRQRNRSIA